MLKWNQIQVNAYEVALVFKNGALESVFEAGKHWIGFAREVLYYKMTEQFTPTIDLDILLDNDTLQKMLEVVEIKDHQIAIQYKNGMFHNVLKPGRYAYWKAYSKFTYDLVDLDSSEIPSHFNHKVVRLPAVMSYIKVLAVESYEKALLYVDGKFEREMNPGVYYFWRGEKVITLYKADLRKQQVEINGQELLTKDKASIRINLTTTYQLSDIYKALINTNDSTKQMYSLMQHALREYVGQYTLDELLANKNAATPYILTYVKEKAEALGYTVLTAGIKDIILPGDVKEIMNQVLVAEKKAQANVIMRREETASTRSLLNTAKLMQDNDMLYKLKEMEYVEKIADNIQNITLQGGGHLVDQLKTIFSGSTK
ncbi:MAG: slipin family protein [Saprospiraceae bacterium]|nr:slipin family protein [Saprospiraceae bacterium]